MVQVWDDMIIDSALKTFYGSDISIMIQAIQRNITVSFFFLNSFLCIYSNDALSIDKVNFFFRVLLRALVKESKIGSFT